MNNPHFYTELNIELNRPYAYPLPPVQSNVKQEL